MPSLYQLYKNPRKRINRRSRTLSLQGCPQKKGILVRLYRVKPKKPNSAQRKVAKIRLCTSKILLVYLPGICLGLYPQMFANALIRGGRVRDLPGIRYKLIRGKYDVYSPLHRRRARSKYGVKNQDNYSRKKIEHSYTYIPRTDLEDDEDNKVFAVDEADDAATNTNREKTIEETINEMSDAKSKVKPLIFFAKSRKKVKQLVKAFKERQREIEEMGFDENINKNSKNIINEQNQNSQILELAALSPNNK